MLKTYHRLLTGVRALNFGQFQHRSITSIVYGRNMSIYFALGKDFDLMVSLCRMWHFVNMSPTDPTGLFYRLIFSLLPNVFLINVTSQFQALCFIQCKVFTLVDYEIGQITCFNSYSLWSKLNGLWHNYESSSSRIHSSYFHRECY